MRVLVVTHYFPPEIGAPQARLSELAGAWADAGDDVTVLTGMPNHPTGVVPPAYRGAIRRVEHTGGYRVVRTWLYATPNEGIVKKTLGHLSFMASSVVLGTTKVGRPEVVVVSSPTFFSILSAWFLARLKRARFVIEIRDLWPAIFVELGVLTNPLAIRLLEAVELASYRAADEVVVVSEGFRDDLIARGIPATKVHTIRNGVDLERFTPAHVATDATDGASGDDADGRAAARTRLGAGPDDTLVLYIGAHGISHGLTAVADAAAMLAGEPVHVAFVGEGAAKKDLEARVAALGLADVTLLPGVPRDEVPGLLAAADICLVPLRDVPLFTTFIPSKIFEYLGAGKAVIGSVRGEPATILEEGGAVVVPPEDPAALADAIRALAADPDRRAAMGRAGRAYVEQHFDRRMLADRYRAILRGDRRTEATVDATSDVATAPAPPGPVEMVRRITTFVWNHPQVRSEGRAGQLKAIARFGAWQAWERAAKKPVTIRMVGGSKLRCHPHSSAATGVLYTRLPEFADMRFVLDYLRTGDLFVDVGSNVGTFSMLAASVPGVRVWAYEPSRDVMPRLQENVAINAYSDRITTRQVAVGAQPGVVQLSIGLDSINHVVAPGEDGSGPPGVETEDVELVTLADDLRAAGSVSLMKIDVEGLEEDVLAGALPLLERDRPALIIEANDVAGIASVLKPLGYQAYAYDPQSPSLDPVDWDAVTGNNVLAIADADRAHDRVGPARRTAFGVRHG